MIKYDAGVAGLYSVRRRAGALVTSTQYRLCIAAADETISAAYRFERETFQREYGVTPAEHDAEFAPYLEQSLLVHVEDTCRRVVGVMRLIHPGADTVASPVKTLVDAARHPWFLDVPRAVRAAGIDVARTWDVATLSVDRTIGRHRGCVLGALYHALVNLAEHNDIRFLLMTVDERVRSTLRMIGLPTFALPGAASMPFEGSPASTPAWGNCADMLIQQRRHNPEAHLLVSRGVGLSDVAMPAAQAFVLATHRDGGAPSVTQRAIFQPLVPLG